MMAPSVMSVHTRETFEAIGRGARQLGNGIHIHIQNGWDPNDRKALQRMWGQDEIPILQSLGLLDAPMFGAHLLGIDLAEGSAGAGAQQVHVRVLPIRRRRERVCRRASPTRKRSPPA